MKDNTTSFLKQRFALWQAVVVFCTCLILTSCKDENVLGLEVQPDNALSPVQFIDTFTIHSKSIVGEAQRSSQYRAFVGALENDEFGRSEAQLYLNFQLESENITLDQPASNYVIERTYLRIFPRELYGNGDVAIPIEAYLLDEEMTLDSIYASNSTFRVDDHPISEAEIQIASNEEIGELLIDTNYSGIIWEFNNEIGSYLLNGLGTVYTNTDQFQSYFPGIRLNIRPDADLSAGGAIYDLAISTGETGVVVEYHSIDDPETTQTLLFEMTSTTSRVNNFTHDASSGELETYLTLPADEQDKLYVQGMAGAKAFIDIPYLDEFALQTDAAISLATIAFTLDGAQPDYLEPSSLLYLLDYEVSFEDGDTIETLNLDYVFSTNRHDGNLDEENGTYTFDITRQVQKVIEAAQQGDDINLGFTLNAQVPVLNDNRVRQNIIQGSDNIVFKVFFTDISK